MNWYRITVRGGAVIACDLVASASAGDEEVWYVEAESAETASQVALLLSRRRKQKRQGRGPAASGSSSEPDVRNTSRLETLEEVAKAWSDSETPSQFVRWLVSEITRIRGAQSPTEPSPFGSSLSGTGVSL